MRDATKGTYNGDTTYCPVNAYGDCPYCDQCNICHIDDPQAECDDWQIFWSNWLDWQNADSIDDDRLDFAQAEIDWARMYYGYDE